MKSNARILYILAYALVMLAMVLASCNKNSTSWANRSYQNMVARYNVYYNGNERLKEAVVNLAINHKDNYNEVLSVFPYGDEEQAKAQQAAMDEIIKKGSKIILNRPVSKWVDDAYLLVGKSYFFKADYYAAIETFQYINTRYKNTPIAQEATVWILKSYIMLKRYNDAEALAGLLRNEKSFSPELVGLFAAASAEVFSKQQKYRPALENIRVALEKGGKRSQRARYSYIAAQLYERLGKPDSAKMYLEKVLKLNPTYDMAFNAKISLARNYDPNDKGQVRSARRYLRSMLRDDKNISYFDQIYYQLGMIEKREGNNTQAVDNFRLSLQNTQENQNQKALSYLALADIYFNQPDYAQAQLYYDSTVQVIQPGFSDYKSIVKKQAVLSELIKYKVIVAREDSLLYLASLPPAELDKRVERWIKEEEEQRKRAEEDKEKKKNQPAPAPGGLPGFPGQPPAPGGAPTAGSGSNWYFYSQQQLSIGYNDFIRRWGNRKLTDDWRWSQKEKELTNVVPAPGDGKGIDPETDPQGDKKAEEDTRLTNIPEEKRKYYRDIPFGDEDKQLANEKIANALYNIGIIYFEKLEDVPEAVAALESLLKRYAGSEYEPRAYYYLYKIFKDRDELKAAEYKNLLISKYPDSDYAILLNEGTLGTNAANTIDPRKTDFYNTTYGLYTSGRYVDVKMRRPIADTMLSGTVLMPKYGLLYAISVGKTESIENYKKELTKIQEQYPATEYSRKAKELMDAAAIAEKKDSVSGPARDTREDLFKNTPDAVHFAAIVFTTGKADNNTVRMQLSNINQSQFPNQSFDVIPSLLNPGQQLLLIRTFEGKDKAMDYITTITKFHKMIFANVEQNEVEYFVISGENYGELLKMKDLAPYKSFYKRYYSK